MGIPARGRRNAGDCDRLFGAGDVLDLQDRTPDTAGTSARFRFSNLDPGQYNVTVFEGRPTDANGQYAKIWVDPDPSGAAEPEDENTGNFAHGFSTMEVSIGAGGLLRNPRRETVRSA